MPTDRIMDKENMVHIHHGILFSHKKEWNNDICSNMQQSKETKELYTENYKTLMKELKDDINRWKDIPCSWVGRINMVKMIILLNAIYRFSVSPIKLSREFFTELVQKFSQFTWKHKRPWIFEKEEWSWRNQLSWLQIILQSYSHQDSMVLAQK